MDANKVWQWRIMRVKEYSRRPEPFYHSNRIGMDFNVASNTRKKMDLQLVTNSVILEVCDFAKTVNKSKRYFITKILENNFDLGLENEQQRIDFTARILHKVKDLLRKPPKDKNEGFILFDTSSNPECNRNNGLDMASTELKTENFLVEMDDTDESEHEFTSKFSQATSKEHIKTESLTEELNGAHGGDSEHEDDLKCSGAQSAEELKEDVLPPSFPYCEGIGLGLDVWSKQSLDPGLLTKGMMLELVHFTRILTASYSPIVLAVLEHNLELDLNSQQAKNRVWFKISHLLKRRKRLITTGSKMSPEFKNETFSFHTNPFKRTSSSALSNSEAPQYKFKEVTKRRQFDLKRKQEKRCLSTTSKRANKRQRRGQSEDMETNTDSHHTDLCTSNQTSGGDHCHTCSLWESDLGSDHGNECDMEQEEMVAKNCYTCPLGESDLDSDEGTDSGNAGDQDHLQNPKGGSLSSDIPRDSELSCLGVCAPLLTTTDVSSSLPSVNSNVNPPFVSQPDEWGLRGGKEQTQTPRNAPSDCDMEEEEMETENNMWKLRANRVKQILSELEFGSFNKSKKFGLEFNVGFGPKKNISVDSLLNCVLLEIAKFALEMNSSQQNFIMEILEYNFDINLQSPRHGNISTCEIMNRVRKLRSCEDAVKFSNEVFELLGPMPSINMMNRSGGSVNAELSSISRMAECDVAPVCPPHSYAETKEHVSQKSVDLYPFCKEIGLKLHVNNGRPNKKLDINKLTNGAMTEVTNFAEKLCGTFEEICLDILRHNLDFDLQSGDSDLARNILARIPAVLEQSNLTKCIKISSRVKQANLAGVAPQDVGSSHEIHNQDEQNLNLWKMRANHVQQILSVPHEEHCPLYSYSRCKKLGIDFNVGSGVKQNLDPKLLTNGIMVELNTFATEMLLAQKHFITEILEYNFHLDFKNELYRSAFAQKTLDKIRLSYAKTKFIRRMKMLFELPDMRCLQKSAASCAKCYLVRSLKLHQDESDPGHMHHACPHTMTDAVSADANCTAQKPAKDPSSTFSAIEKTIMDSYPRCKEIDLNLCVDKDQPKDKLDTHILTLGIMSEVAGFTKKLCGLKNKIINDVVEHNFNIDMQGRKLNPAVLFQRVTKQNDGSHAWFSEEFVIQDHPHRPPGYGSKVKQAAAMQRSEWKEAIKKRKLALQTKKERTTMPSLNIGVVKSKTKCPSKGKSVGVFTEIGLDVDMISKSGEKEKLDLKLLTKAVCGLESEEIAAENYYYTCPLGESDLDSDEATDSGNPGFHIPRDTESSCLGVCAPLLNTTDVSSSLPSVNSNVNPPFASQPDERGFNGGEEQTQTPRNAPSKCDMEEEEMGTENNMWKLRANRVKQILSELEFGSFNKSKKFGLEFNVGFGPKKNISFDSLLNCVLLEIAKFALEMNSSQQNFIMEILEYNFDINLQSQRHGNISTCEIMNRVRKLRSCEDAVKFSNEVFELLGPMPSINMMNRRGGSVNAELSSISRMAECDVAPVCPPHSHAETKEHVSEKSVDLYPFCKEIGLKLHVNNGRPNKKLDINKLTNGAMTEVTNFAEKLCGTFEEICLDILRHNLDFDLQSGDSDLARNILARIPAVLEQSNLTKYIKISRQVKRVILACSTDQDVGSSPEIQHQDELNLNLWKMRANHVQQILSVPHEEHCPLYSYSRCKKLGIDFDVGSGVKQNLDPKLLTNGLMVELNTFATEMLLAQKHFITEILEYNFHLDLKNELYRSSFAQKILGKIRLSYARTKNCIPRMKMLFELPDMRCIEKRSACCAKCFQVRNLKLCQDESDPGLMHHPRPHTITDAVSVGANCTAQKPAKDPSSTFSAIEKTIMDSYHRCKEIGLNLCVDKCQPKDKLDTHVLTHGIMYEVASFARKLCGSKNKIINDVVEHNFNIDMQGRELNPAVLFQRVTKQNDGSHAWFSEEFVIQDFPHRPPGYVSKLKRAASMQRSEWQEAIKKRKLALQTKEERTPMPSLNIGVVKSKTKRPSKGKSVPVFTEIGLDLDMTSKSREKEKMDMKLLTKAVCGLESEEIAAENYYYTCPLGESDLDSDDVTDSGNAGDQDHLQNPKGGSLSSDIPRDSESSCLGVCAPLLTTTDVSSSLPSVNSNVNPPFASQPDERGFNRGEELTQTPRNAPSKCDMEEEEMGTENNMWKLRANRVKQILSELEFGSFNRSKKFGLEFNVGFGPKKNISVDSLLNSVLLEIAKFALEINSSQQNFIMEILEYNFDINLQSQRHGNISTCEIMNRVRTLRSCEDAVKFSNEVFELLGPMPSINMMNRSGGSVNAELSSISRMTACDVAPVCPPHSHAETKEHVSEKSVDLYPFCKEIGLKLHVNNGRPNKKLDINKLTNGAMTEVTNFAEKLCGTFEEICLDILRHNLDLDLQSGDSDLAISILARIPAVMEQRNLTTCVKAYKKMKGTRKDSSTTVKLDCQNNPILACVAPQDVGSSPDIQHQDELNLNLWKMRANHVQQILSVPHEEHCPLYSYSRCKKLGIDFNVGSGVKQNLDPKLLTNGIMVELNTFATAMLSAQKHFITEILEYNFHLDLKDELYRSAFAQMTLDKIRAKTVPKRCSLTRLKRPFELPDTRCIQDATFDKTTYCPKCYQDRNHKLHQDEPDPSHMHHACPHTMTDAVSADANRTAQKPAKDPSSTFSAIEKTIMDSYPSCQDIGLNLCVDKDQPKDKLDTHVLTHGIMSEVVSFAKRLCGTKSKIIHAVLEHNFNIGMQRRGVDIAQLFRRATALKEGGLAWFNEVFVIQPFSHRQPGYVSKIKQAAALYRDERKETIKKRQLALKTKKERVTLPSRKVSVVKKSKRPPVNCYPICKEIGLDLDLTSKSREKRKLDLQLLTRAVVFEIYKFATKKLRHYLPHTVYDILDYNFDLSSQHHRRLEFSIAATSEIQTMVKYYHKNQYRGEEVFKLPFVFDEEQIKKSKKHPREKTDKKKNEGHFVCRVRYRSDVSCVHFLDGVKTNQEDWLYDEDSNFPPDRGTVVQMNGGLVSEGCGSRLQGNLQIKEEEYDPHYGNSKPEPNTGKNYRPHYDVKTESNTGCVKHLVPGGPTGSLGYTSMTLWPNSKRQKTESVQYICPSVCPNAGSNINTEPDTEAFNDLVPVEPSGSSEYFMVTIGEGTLIKEEEENVPVDTHHYRDHRK